MLAHLEMLKALAESNANLDLLKTVQSLLLLVLVEQTMEA
jgi:hypothetical protein